MENPKFDNEPQTHKINQFEESDEGLEDQSFFDAQDDDDPIALEDEDLDDWEEENEDPIALEDEDEYGLGNPSDGWENWGKDPDEEPDAWDISDTYWE